MIKSVRCDAMLSGRPGYVGEWSQDDTSKECSGDLSSNNSVICTVVWLTQS
jgi:hypothetical protein